MKVGDLVRDTHKGDVGIIVEIDGEPEQHRMYRVLFSNELLWLMATYLEVIS